MAAQPFDITARHAAPREPDASLGEFWLASPFDFEARAGFNLSRFERNRLFLNRGKANFVDVSALSSVDLDADSRAVAVGDINNDGRPDLVVRSVGGGPLRVFLNEIATGGASLKLRLRGRASNWDGIGARLWLTVGDKTLYREHFPQNTLYAQNANETIFGLGQHEGPVTLKILWPSGTEQVIEDIRAGAHTLIEK